MERSVSTRMGNEVDCSLPDECFDFQQKIQRGFGFEDGSDGLGLVLTGKTGGRLEQDGEDGRVQKAASGLPISEPSVGWPDSSDGDKHKTPGLLSLSSWSMRTNLTSSGSVR